MIGDVSPTLPAIPAAAMELERTRQMAGLQRLMACPDPAAVLTELRTSLANDDGWADGRVCVRREALEALLAMVDPAGAL